MSRDAQVNGGYGRGMDNKKSRTTKRKHDRIVDKRRRREGKRLSVFGSTYGG
jgi:hypothetical protein